MKNSNQILHGDQNVLERKNSTRRPRCCGQHFVKGMLTRDLFAVVNVVFVFLRNCCALFTILLQQDSQQSHKHVYYVASGWAFDELIN